MAAIIELIGQIIGQFRNNSAIIEIVRELVISNMHNKFMKDT